MKKLRVTVDGKVYEVIVEELEGASPAAAAPAPVPGLAQGASLSAPASAPPPASATPAASGPGEVPSPLSGKVVAINCTLGQEVAAGDTLITLEAMKMNTFVQAPSAGAIKAIMVKEGDAVQEGQPLVAIG